MDKKKSGFLVEITEGPRKGQRGTIYQEDIQKFKDRGMTPVCFPGTDRKMLFKPHKVKIVGFSD